MPEIPIESANDMFENEMSKVQSSIGNTMASFGSRMKGLQKHARDMASKLHGKGGNSNGIMKSESISSSSSSVMGEDGEVHTKSEN